MAFSVRATLRVYWQHVRKYKALATVITVSLLLLNISELLTPLLYKKFTDTATSDLPAADMQIALVAVIMSILGVHIFRWVVFRVAAFTNTYFQPRVMTDLHQTAFEHLLGHSYRFFSNAFAGSLVRKVHRLGRAFETFADQLQWSFLKIFVTIIGILIIFGLRSPILAVIVGVWVVVFVAANVAYSRWKLKYDEERATLDSEMTGLLSDALSNVISVKQFTGITYERHLFRDVTERLRRIYTFTWGLGEVNDALQMALMIVLEFVIMYAAVPLYITGTLTIGDFVLIQSSIVLVFITLWDFGRTVRRVYESFADAQEMVDILNTPHEIVDTPNAKTLEVPEGKIELRDVTFAYNDKRVILNNFNLVIAPKEKVAFVGSSGAGKSTIIKLLLRFFDVTHGAMLIDEQNIVNVTQESLRENVSLVPQEAVLFHRTLMENIRYGRRDASDAEVIAASKKAHCHEFIVNLANGYGTMVGERGVKLSGGERQRVAIARAILKDAPILILDEATSSLDSESESLIQDALHALMENKTVIVIAHRLSTIMEMDRIVVIEKGQVADTGTHRELLQREGTYKKLWSIQAGGFLP